ncbi:MAG: hypothetical protein KUA35_16675 [Pseudodesulfovibrio sp.]|uniref:Thioredoxin-like fold domain-containing protein n=1 Tax=Pseudodesulfovibrio aespoeensis (strain ATCC 700646 / DSM 10631 / Aspo-2) TaxID=643562 RepID=E6VVN8_PSEA9|nr:MULTISPECIES: hypothetical protein [Pseudodesulfovibrio]MBU4192543.1 hypothetical protein [Pseudomonadota bacterium]ADU63596.1 hypothetical protein Daes_2598 [Pseudodesulfovibrio aespoeensis Aspo-2]MBU4244760.1 hypothetical protein [Pseudomonadota bacterium]MBU4378845.1 hypothetical protein [Pseudomonadota bacterium]MBU4475295.1 hypothetical protein [Pseudomonadota bacterium]
MRKSILPILLAALLTVSLFIPAAGLAADPAVSADQPGCAPQYRALADAAVVEIRGTGDMEAVVVTDPLCWHCRLGHKLLGQYPELYGSLKLLFFPRAGSIGSDMAAWIIEDAAGTERLGLLLDFAYGTLRQPKTADLDEARMLVLAQFAEAFPAMLSGTTLPELFDRLKQDHEAHVLAGAELARTAEIPGTPVLIAGGVLVMGYGPDAWLKALGEAGVCK